MGSSKPHGLSLHFCAGFCSTWWLRRKSLKAYLSTNGNVQVWHHKFTLKPPLSALSEGLEMMNTHGDTLISLQRVPKLCFRDDIWIFRVELPILDVCAHTRVCLGTQVYRGDTAGTSCWPSRFPGLGFPQEKALSCYFCVISQPALQPYELFGTPQNTLYNQSFISYSHNTLVL